MRITAEHVIRFIQGVAARIKEHRDELVALDSAIGDADHGINMDRGFSTVLEKLPTVETSVMPTVLSRAPMSSPSNPSSFATAAFMPRSMFVPWSASPIAESSRVRYSLFSATVEAKALTQPSTWAYETLTPTASRRPTASPECGRERPRAA